MRPSNKKMHVSTEDDNIRYKINTQYYSNSNRVAKPKELQIPIKNAEDEDQIRYMLPSILKTKKPEIKKKTIKVNFWSNKPTRLQTKEFENHYRRHTISSTYDTKSKSPIKVKKRVSFLPTPIFSDNHNPMVTVPDDLTINLNEDEVLDLQEDLNSVTERNNLENGLIKSPKANPSPRGVKRKHSEDHSNSSELEFFSKYVVQKLRRMDTNQRIYSENLINTVLMYGQLGKLNGKCKLTET